MDSKTRREEQEKLCFFETAREQAEADWRKNTKDAGALTRWGGALLELAHFRQGNEAVELIDQAVSKLEAAIKLNPKKHDALWCLGNALTSQGFLFTDPKQANTYFERARSCFQRALNEEPKNDTYKKAIEMTAKAPYLHAELQKQVQQQQQQMHAQGAGFQGAATGEKDEKNAGDDFYYDVAGWVVLAGLAVGWVMLARNSMK
mmetsp:Transcript_25105/g.30387  ORF Transcript_25105/g.30387 Transcript_25105/m.30387 type:complete len:204 (-) Transcript_25105:562-1173(-)|eukprot:CAMPEP_0197846798 /NCGR_PEP_ID=MMETSP1438-20131217/4393_1 /TAXON_ID=1461541 /ORGANISM="Pterosperma sp., Strain CCMP1384" /LENGTH=203 /DNA_ID=CAMNT_0043458561 /DNA_START=81 /DNA_END=692 /DNA_ORIENTATION=+